MIEQLNLNRRSIRIDHWAPNISALFISNGKSIHVCILMSTINSLTAHANNIYLKC